MKAKTGKTWPEWFAILDAAGAKKMTHKEIVATLYNDHGPGDWWQQMVTVGYEQARGLRDKHQKTDGYAVSASKTFAVPASTLFKAWSDAKIRKKWLSDSITIRKTAPDKSLRITWADGKSSVTVNLYAKGASKSQVTVQHEKIASAKEASRLKKYWGEQLVTLKEMLEG